MNEKKLNLPEASSAGSSAITIHADLPPLRVDDQGAIRVGASRVSLDLVVEQYENGTTPESLARAYDTLELADVHAVIAYYLRHTEEVRAYLSHRAAEAAALQAKIESERPRVPRDEMLARYGGVEQVHAATRQ